MSTSEIPFLTTVNDDLVLSVYIQPRASANQICGIQGEELKIRLTSPPVDGAANKLCREFIAELFNVPKSAVKIVFGETSRHKRLRITGTHSGQFTAAISAITESLKTASIKKGSNNGTG